LSLDNERCTTITNSGGINYSSVNYLGDIEHVHQQQQSQQHEQPRIQLLKRTMAQSASTTTSIGHSDIVHEYSQQQQSETTRSGNEYQQHPHMYHSHQNQHARSTEEAQKHLEKQQQIYDDQQIKEKK
jgi:hypothetical protein